MKFLPDETIYSKSPPRKWPQIQIWTDGPNFNLHFKSLASSLCRIPSKWKFPWHRITLRVGMCPSCSTSHWKYWNNWKINWKSCIEASGAPKMIFTKILPIISFFGSRVQTLIAFSVPMKPITWVAGLKNKASRCSALSIPGKMTVRSSNSLHLNFQRSIFQLEHKKSTPEKNYRRTFFVKNFFFEDLA